MNQISYFQAFKEQQAEDTLCSNTFIRGILASPILNLPEEYILGQLNFIFLHQNRIHAIDRILLKRIKGEFSESQEESN